MSRWRLALLIALCGLAGPAPAEPVPVTVQPIEELVIFPQRSAPATVLSLNDSRISAELSARIIDFPVLVGQAVKRGEVLARLDERDYRHALARAEAALGAVQARIELAQFQLERAKTLVAQKVASQELLNQRQAELDVLLAERAGAQAALQQAQYDLERCTLLAPFDAVVVERIAQLGELLRPGDALVRILDTRQIEIAAQLQASDIASLQAAGRIEFIEQARRYPVQLRTLVPALDPRSRTREVRLRFIEAAALPGSAGRLSWSERRPHLPAGLLVQRDGRLGVFVLNSDSARFVALEQAQEGRPAPVELPAGTRLIVEGRHRLRDGDPVRTP